MGTHGISQTSCPEEVQSLHSSVCSVPGKQGLGCGSFLGVGRVQLGREDSYWAVGKSNSPAVLSAWRRVWAGVRRTGRSGWCGGFFGCSGRRAGVHYSDQSIFLKATLSTLCSGNDLFSFLSSPFSAHCSLWNWVLGRVPTVWGKRHQGGPLVRRAAVGDGGWKEAESLCGGNRT